MKTVWGDWPALKNRIFSHKKKLLLLDFDGTLVPIAKSPGQIIFEKRIRKTLSRLSKRTDYRIFIISGRSLRDLKKWIRHKHIGCIGNHGFEMAGMHSAVPPALLEARKLKATIALMAEVLREHLASFSQVFIEDKGYTLSVHFRGLPARATLSFNRKLNALKKSYRHLLLEWKKGKKTWEIRPKVRWSKGEASSFLFKKYPGSLPVVIGDDKTDEDMFKALKHHGITIHVGKSKKSAAGYLLSSSKEVEKFLRKLSLEVTP